MTDEERLIERLKLVEALHAGAATPGERDVAASARARILDRLKEFTRSEPPVEYSFKLADAWSRKLFVALLRRYDIRPYRYPRQRHTTVMARVPVSFVKETLWPEFLELNKSLQQFLSNITERVIREGVHGDDSEPELRPQTAALNAPGTLESGEFEG